MNQNDKDIYALRFQRFQQSREKFFAPKFYAALNSQYKTFTDSVRSMGIHAVDQITPYEIMKVLEDLYYDAGVVYGAKVRAELNRQKARMPIGFSERMHKLIMDYFGQDILNIAKGITETTKDIIRNVFINAAAQGFGIDDIVKRIINPGLNRNRARLIARTETVTSANGGARIVAIDSGLVLIKGWLATKDSRTRHDHAEVDGHTVGRDDYFIVGGFEMLHPGDRGGHDGKPLVDGKEVINCRCTTIYESVRNSQSQRLRA